MTIKHDWLTEPFDPSVRVIEVTRAQFEEKEPLPSFPRPKSAYTHYFPKTPLHIVHAVVAAGAEVALPLIFAAHRQMHMRESNSLVLTNSIWRAAGPYETAERRKRTVLKHLREIPDVLVLTKKRSPIAHYRVAYGPLWKQTPKIQLEDEGP
jgi:hypothetical protein